MAAAHVFTCTKEWTSGTSIATDAWTVGAGNALVVFFGARISAPNGDKFASISDGTNTYTNVDNLSANFSGDCLFGRTLYAKNVAGGSTTVTVTLSDTTGVNDAFVGIEEWSGVDTSSPLDAHAINTQTDPGTSADALTSTAAATSQNGDAITGFTRTMRGGTINLTAGTGFTSRFTVSGSPMATMAETQVQAASGSIAATFTPDFSDAASGWVSAMVALKASGGAWGRLLSDELNRLVRT